MKFFNPKEEVLDIKLTQYGKYLLSMGKWKPTYYAFFDSDVLYDGAAAHLTEVQNDIEPRIQEDTPRLRTQYSFSSRETDFAKYYQSRQDSSLTELERIRMQSTPEKLYSLTAPLGTADLNFNKAPRFKLQIYSGEIENSTDILSGSFQKLQIPQIDMDVTYVTEVKNLQEDATATELQSGIVDPWLQAEGMNLGIYADGSYIAITPADILLTLEEKNAFFDKENFDIEVYKIEYEIDSVTTEIKEVMVPLSFLPKDSPIKDGILQMRAGLPPIHIADPSFVEYYFDLYVDHEIDEGAICRSVAQLKSMGLYTDEELNCPDVPFSPVRKNIYGPNGYVDIEICDTGPSNQIPRATYTRKD